MRRSLIAFGLLAAVSCRDKTPAASDSSLAGDLAMAQRAAPPQAVFNDAPLGANAPAAKSAAAPSPKPEPPRVSRPTPRPSPRRDSPPARVARTPDPTPTAPVQTAPAAAPSSTGPAPGIIGAGSRIGMATNSRACAATLLPGDKITATVSSGVTGSNGANISPGATIVLEVASIERGDPIENTRIDFRVRSVDVNGEAMPVTGDVATLGTMEKIQIGGGNEREKIIGGAIAGAVLGRIFGKSTKGTIIGAAAGTAAGAAAARAGQSSDACLPLGSALRLTLSHDVVVRKSPI